jgi:hypothetical protein
MSAHNKFRESSGSESRRSVARGIVEHAFGGIVALWPADSRDWALAMQAELIEMESTQESLQWLAGGIMSLGKAWWNQVVYGWKGDEKEPSTVKTPGPVALALAVAALIAFFMVPSVHEGFSAVVNSWQSYSDPHQADYQRMAREAEANHDAKTLAFVGSRMGNLQENARVMNEAVEMDPSFAWIYVRGSDSRYLFTHFPQSQGWMQKLEAIDPDNAVPYLKEASMRESEILRQSNYQFSLNNVLSDPQWRAAMEKAFATSKYDSYYDRAIALQQYELKAHNLTEPQDVARGIAEYYSGGIFEAQKYSEYLLRQAKEAQQKGDAATASRLAWSVAQFADRARANMHNEVARGTVEGMLYSASVILIPLETAAGHTETAKLLTIEKEGYEKKLAARVPYRTPYIYRPLNTTGIALQFAGLGMVLFGGLILLSIAFLLVARFAQALREGAFYRWACNCGRFGPAGFAAATVLMAALYAPYLDHLQDFLAGARDTGTLQSLAEMASFISATPALIFNPMNVSTHLFYFWTALLVVSIIAGVLFLTRKVVRPNEPNVKAA